MTTNERSVGRRQNLALPPGGEAATVPQEPGKEVSDKVLAAIVEISRALRHIRTSRLKRKALSVLLSYQTKLGLGSVEAVLDGLEALESAWCNPTKKVKNG